MDFKTKNFIDSLKTDCVPWGRMVTAYGTALHYPEYLEILESMSDIKRTEYALNSISDFEHQETMFPPAPFALVFLIRILEKALCTKNNECADFLAKEIADFSEHCLWACNYAETYEHEKPLRNFSDMLIEKYLLDPEYSKREPSEEEADEIFGDENFLPDDLFYSIYYYSKIVLSQVPDILEKYDRFPEIREKMNKML